MDELSKRRRKQPMSWNYTLSFFLMMAVGGLARGVYYTATGDFGHRAWGDPGIALIVAVIVTVFIGVPADLISHYRSRRSPE